MPTQVFSRHKNKKAWKGESVYGWACHGGLICLPNQWGFPENKTMQSRFLTFIATLHLKQKCRKKKKKSLLGSEQCCESAPAINLPPLRLLHLSHCAGAVHSNLKVLDSEAWQVRQMQVWNVFSKHTLYAEHFEYSLAWTDHSYAKMMFQTEESPPALKQSDLPI